MYGQSLGQCCRYSNIVFCDCERINRQRFRPKTKRSITNIVTNFININWCFLETSEIGIRSSFWDWLAKWSFQFFTYFQVDVYWCTLHHIVGGSWEVKINKHIIWRNRQTLSLLHVSRNCSVCKGVQKWRKTAKNRYKFIETLQVVETWSLSFLFLIILCSFIRSFDGWVNTRWEFYHHPSSRSIQQYAICNWSTLFLFISSSVSLLLFGFFFVQSFLTDS